MTNQIPVSSFAAHGLLGRAFWATLLLTGDVARAEAAVLHAIEGSEPDPLSDETFLISAVTAAVAGTEKNGEQCAILPLELRQVSRLPPRLRHCFVLRTLISFNGEACAPLLNLTAGEVDAVLCQAMQQLVRLAQVVTR